MAGKNTKRVYNPLAAAASLSRAEDFARRYNAKPKPAATSAITKPIDRREADDDTVRLPSNPQLGMGAGVAPQVPVAPIVPITVRGPETTEADMGRYPMEQEGLAADQAEARAAMAAGVQNAGDAARQRYSSDRQWTQWNNQDTAEMQRRGQVVADVQAGRARMYNTPITGQPGVGIDTGGKPMVQPARYDYTDTTNVEGNPVGRPLSQATVATARQAAGLDTAAGKSPITREQADAAAAGDDVRKAYAQRQAEKAEANRQRYLAVKGIQNPAMREQAALAAQRAGAGWESAIKPMTRGFGTAEDMRRFDEAEAMRTASETANVGQVQAHTQLLKTQAEVAMMNARSEPQRLRYNAAMQLLKTAELAPDEETAKLLIEQANKMITDSQSAGATDTPITQSIKEGTVATNPKTGERIVMRNGQWVAL